MNDLPVATAECVCTCVYMRACVGAHVCVVRAVCVCMCVVLVSLLCIILYYYKGMYECVYVSVLNCIMVLYRIIIIIVFMTGA